jgi:hypothetical protein
MLWFGYTLSIRFHVSEAWCSYGGAEVVGS